MGQFMDPIKIRGDFDLEDLENKCGTIQNLVPCKLIRVTKKNDDGQSKSNVALFEEVEIGNTPPKPKIIEIQNPEQIATIIAEQMAANRKMIFDSTVYAQNVETRVIGFR